MKAGRAASILAVALSGFALSACGNGASSLGKQACGDVAKSIILYNESLRAGSPAAVSHLTEEATVELRLALPLAAAAADDDTTWQPLEATLSETNRFSRADGSPNQGKMNEGELITALTAQCPNVPS